MNLKVKLLSKIFISKIKVFLSLTVCDNTWCYKSWLWIIIILFKKSNLKFLHKFKIAKYRTNGIVLRNKQILFGVFPPLHFTLISTDTFFTFAHVPISIIGYLSACHTKKPNQTHKKLSLFILRLTVEVIFNIKIIGLSRYQVFMLSEKQYLFI